jgi:hypothetical protein
VGKRSRLWKVAIYLAVSIAGLAPIATSAAAAEADDLARQINDLAHKIAPNITDTKVNDAIKNLTDSLVMHDCSVSVTPTLCVQRLEEVVASLQKMLAAAPDAVSVQSNRISIQIDALINLLSPKDATTAAAYVAADLNTRLNDTGNPADVSKKKLSDALAALKMAVDRAATPKAEPPTLISVLDAYYGALDDLGNLLCARETKTLTRKSRRHGIITWTVTRCKKLNPQNIETTGLNSTAESEVKSSFSSSRYCSATQAIRARCQGQAACLNDAFPSPLTAAELCGFDPAPYAQPAKKGLLINYRCISKDDPAAFAVGFLSTPPKSNPSPPPQAQAQGQHPPAQAQPDDSPAQSSDPSKWVLLRLNEDQRLICSTPPQATKQTGNSAGQTPAPTPTPGGK